MGQRYPHSDNEDGFEQQCLRFYRKLWGNESLKLYGKRGQNQDGVDICDPLGISPLRAVQCKHHEPHKKLKVEEIHEEVAKAEKSHFKIEHYVIVTTAQRDRGAQDAVYDLNQRPDKQFETDIHYWDDVCLELQQFGALIVHEIIEGKSLLLDADVASEINAQAQAIAQTSEAISDGQYSEIEELLEQHKTELARYELDKQPAGAELGRLDRQRAYRLLRLRGKLALQEGDFGAASDYFEKAFEVDPSTDQAKANHALAFFLRDDHEKTHNLAVQYINEGIVTSPMVQRLIDSALSVDALAEHLELIESHQSEPNVCTSMSYLCLRSNELEESLRYARLSLDLDPESANRHLAAAMALHQIGYGQDAPQRFETLRDSLGSYDRAIDLLPHEGSTRLRLEIVVNRAAVRYLTGDFEGSTDDFLECAKAGGRYAESAVRKFLQDLDFDTAWELLEFIDRDTPTGKFLALVTEYEKGGDLEQESILRQLSDLADEEWADARQCRAHCVERYIRRQQWGHAERLLTESFRSSFPFQAHTLHAWVKMASGDVDGARADAEIALKEEISEASYSEVRVLADLLIDMQEDKKALPLLMHVTRPGVLDYDMKTLISCAQRIGRDDLLISLCRELRMAGARDRRLWKLELQLMYNYQPPQALELIEELWDDFPDRKYLTAFRNRILVRLRRIEDVDLREEALPSAAELLPEEAGLVVVPFLATKRFDDILQFLYEQRRKHFENEKAHSTFVSFFIHHERQFKLVSAPEVVSGECAVHLKSTTAPPRWVVLEDSGPVASRHEFATSSSLASCLMNRRVGESVTLHQNQTATITAIQSKYVRAFQHSIETCHQQFPETSFLQQVHVGVGDDFDPTPIREIAVARREHVDESIEIYRKNLVPIHVLADMIGLSDFETVDGLMSLQNTQIRCCSESDVNIDGPDTRLPSTVVLDASSVLTLSHLDAWHFLSSNTLYLVSQLTSETIDAWISVAESGEGHEGGSIAADDAGQLMLTPTSHDDRDRERARGLLETARNGIDIVCEVRSSTSMAILEPEKRRLYSEVLGVHNLESLSLARDEGAEYWTDDHFLGLVALHDFDVSRTWTQRHLEQSTQAGMATEEQFNLWSAKLVAWGYVSTLWSGATVAAAGQEADWDPEAWPLSECITTLTTSNLHVSKKARIVLEFLRQLRRTEVFEVTQTAVIRAILNAIDSPVAVKWILERLEITFGGDVDSEGFLRLNLRFWLEHRA